MVVGKTSGMECGNRYVRVGRADASRSLPGQPEKARNCNRYKDFWRVPGIGTAAIALRTDRP